MIDCVGFNVPLNTLQVISGTSFYGSNDPTNSVKALKEVVVLRIGFNPTRSTSPCYNNYTEEDRRQKKKKPQDKNIMSASGTQGGRNKFSTEWNKRCHNSRIRN